MPQPADGNTHSDICECRSKRVKGKSNTLPHGTVLRIQQELKVVGMWFSSICSSINLKVLWEIITVVPFSEICV